MIDENWAFILMEWIGWGKMMEYCISEYVDYNEQEILPLYESVGWQNYTQRPQMLKEAYAHSLKIYAAYVNNKLAGIIRVVGDGASVVFVQDLLVYPEYQRQGIGTKMIKYVREQLKQETEKISYIVLNTEKGYPSVKFYEANGFKADESLVFMAADV